MPDHVPLQPHHVIQAAQAVQAALRPGLKADWSVPAGTLAWDCRQTLDHMINAPLMYATSLAMRSTERLRNVRNGDPSATIEELVDSLDRAATILADVARAAPPEARGFHGAGMPTLRASLPWPAMRS